jgi:hypothetical protein
VVRADSARPAKSKTTLNDLRYFGPGFGRGFFCFQESSSPRVFGGYEGRHGCCERDLSEVARWVAVRGADLGASNPKEGLLATVLGVGTLVFAALGLVVQLKDALNTV